MLNRIGICFSLLLMIHFSMAQKTINDPNAQVRSLGEFSNISISSAIDLYISQSSEYAVAVSAKDAKLVKSITTEVKNGTLYISFDGSGFKDWGSGKQMKAYVSIKNIGRLQASGSCDIYVDGSINATDLTISLSGSSDFKGIVNVQNLRLEASNSSDFHISGKTINLKVTATGSSDVKGYDLIADNCDIEASGASDVKLTINKQLKAKTSGSSNITYKGEPTVKQVFSSGSSDIKQIKN